VVTGWRRRCSFSTAAVFDISGVTGNLPVTADPPLPQALIDFAQALLEPKAWPPAQSQGRIAYTTGSKATCWICACYLVALLAHVEGTRSGRHGAAARQVLSDQGVADVGRAALPDRGWCSASFSCPLAPLSTVAATLMHRRSHHRLPAWRATPAARDRRPAVLVLACSDCQAIAPHGTSGYPEPDNASGIPTSTTPFWWTFLPRSPPTAHERQAAQDRRAVDRPPCSTAGIEPRSRCWPATRLEPSCRWAA
jgi:hypothetical protein